MALMVKHNLAAINTLNQLNKNDSALQKDVQRLSSGMKINGAADDASGYAIADKMDVQVRSLSQDSQNTQNGQSMLDVASGAVSSTVDILRTLKEKVINAANDTNSDTDRAIIQKELNQAVDQIDDNAQVTYNGQILLDGSRNNKVVEPGTCTTFVNTSLAEDISSFDTPLIDYHERSGNSLGIFPGDKLNVSYVKDGRTVTQSVDIDEDTVLQDVFAFTDLGNIMGVRPNASDPSLIGYDQYGDAAHTIDGKAAIVFQAAHPGLSGQLAGLTFSVVRGSDGQVNKMATAKLDEFTEVIRAQDPTPDNAVSFQTGTRSNQTVKIGLTDMRATALGLKGQDGTVLNISTQASANAAINVLDNALQKALDQQTNLGSVTSRLDYTDSNITTSNENTLASQSTIRDADMAREMTAYTKDSVLSQAAQAMLAQANQTSSSVLSLLQGQ